MESRKMLKIFDLKDLSSVTSVLLVAIGSCVLWKLILGIGEWYGVWRKLPPGPWGLPIVGYLPFLGNAPHKTFWNLKQKYGDIISVYLGTKCFVILNDYKIMKEVLCNTAALDRAPEVFDHLSAGFAAENGETWLEQRRFCFSAAKDLGLGRSHWEDVVMEGISSLTRKLKELNEKPVDISFELEYSLNSNIIAVMIGRRLKEHEESEKVKLSMDYSDVALTLADPSSAITVIPGLRRLCEILKIGNYERSFKLIQKFESFIQGQINLHKTSPALHDEQDFINSYLKKISDMSMVNKENHSFTEKMLQGSVIMLFLGTSDTMFSSLTWLFRLMCEHKDVQEKVHNELMEVLGKDGRARYEEKHKLPYTTAVIMETLRISSNVPLSTTRKCNQDIHVNGYVIPKGSDISANLWGIHHDPAYWDEPEIFRPERFLTDGGTKLIKQPPSYVPFSIGRRNCPGETIGWIELLLYYSEIIKKFEISVAPGVKPEFRTLSGLVSRLVPQPLCFKERNI